MEKVKISESSPKISLSNPNSWPVNSALKLKPWNAAPELIYPSPWGYLLLALQLLSRCHSPANEIIWRHWKPVYLFSPADLFVCFVWDNSPVSKISYLWTVQQSSSQNKTKMRNSPRGKNSCLLKRFARSLLKSNSEKNEREDWESNWMPRLNTNTVHILSRATSLLSDRCFWVIN